MPPWDIENVVWQDRELRFDSAPGLMGCRKGEVVIDSINSVEDTKGNNGERGEVEHYIPSVGQIPLWAVI